MRTSSPIILLILLSLLNAASTGCSSEDGALRPAPSTSATHHDHPAQIRLVGFVHGGLTSRERASVAEHLRGCGRCEDYVASVESANTRKQFLD